MLRQRLGVLCKLSWQLLRLRFSGGPDKDHRSRRLLFEQFKHLGGVYIKFLQMLSLNVDFLQGWASPSEFDVFEAVDYETIDVTKTLQAEVPHYSQQFLSVDVQPFAAGSFAQVYRGQLLDGTDVIIKILRPSLTRNLDFDLRLLAIITRVASWLYPTTITNANVVYRQFAVTTRAETDYITEARNARWFHEYFRNVAEIVIPKTFQDLSSEHVIVQEFIGGISVAELLSVQKQGYDPAVIVQQKLGSDLWQQLQSLGYEFLKSTVLADFVIGDPHPGNIKLLPDNKVGLIDFGIAAPAPRNRQAFLNLIYEYQKLYNEAFDAHSFTIAMLSFFDEALVQALTTVGKLMNPSEPIDFMNMIGSAAAQTLTGKMHQANTQTLLRRKMMSRLFGQTINSQNRFGVYLNLQAMNVFKAAHIYLSTVGSLGKNGENFIVLQRAINDTIATIERVGIALETPSNPLSTDQSVELVSGWLARLADNDPFLFQQLTATISL